MAQSNRAMISVDTADVNLFHVEKGAGQPVLFVHGIPTDYRAWNSQIDPLSAHYRVIAYSSATRIPTRERATS